MRIKFDYIDANGKKSTRTVRDIWVKNSEFIDAYCETRKADRTFALRRIINPFDLEKNAPIDDMEEFFGILDADGEIKEEYMEDRINPSLHKIDCHNCGGLSEISHAYALEHDKFVCDCGQVFNITKVKK